MRTLWRNAGAYIALAVVTIIFAILLPEFRQPSNVLNVLDQSARVAVIAVGMTAIILTGGIDLSVGSIAALAPFLGAWVMVHFGGAAGGFMGSALVGLVVAFSVGGLVGAFNGLAITKAYLPPFIATLGMMIVARGLVYILSGGTGIRKRDIPAGYLATAGNIFSFQGTNSSTVSLTWAVIVMLAVFVAGYFVLTKTAIGRAIYAIGGNEQASRLSGLRVDRIKLGVYIACGMLAALAGLIEAASDATVAPQAGDNLELDAIAAVVIGGTSLSGGKGNLAGTFAGALLMRVIRNGLNIANVDSNWQRVVIGAIIIIAVGFDEIQKRRRLKT